MRVFKTHPKRNAARIGQSELIAGVLILSVIFAAVIPLMLRIQTSSVKMQQNIINKADFIRLRNTELLSMNGVAGTPKNIAKGIYPGLWINNTGSIPVTLHTLILVNKNTGNLDYIINLSEVGAPFNPDSIISWAVINPGTNPIKLQKGYYPVLKPGDSLLIKLSMTPTEASNYIFKVITATGNVMPKGGSSAYIIPSTTGGGTEWRGIFYPTSGFRLIGADQILAHSTVLAERPLGIADDGYVDHVTRSYIYDDYEHPGYYIVGYQLSDGYSVEYRGFIGTFYMGTDYVYIDGYYLQKYIDGILVDTAGKKVFSYPSSFGVEYDYDNNSVKELGINTIQTDADKDGNPYDDTLVMKILIDKDITNADYIHISAKVTYDYYIRVINQLRDNYRMDLRIFYVALYKYTSAGWRFVHYKDVPFSEFGPRSFVFDASFPLNRSDIYRVVVMLLDPYTETGRNYYEFYVGLEYLFVEWGINNPYLENLPTIYLLALNDKPVGGIGQGNATDNLGNLTNVVEQELLSIGVSNYIVVDNEELLKNLLIDNPPKNAIIINLHGNESPVDPDDVKNYVANYGWIWVNIVENPPVNPGVQVDNTTNTTAGPGPDWSKMVRTFNLYNLKNSVWSNYTIVLSGSNPPTYVFYENSSGKRLVSAAWAVGKGYIIVNTLPPIDWSGKDPHATDPHFCARLAIFPALYIWSATKP